LPEVTELTVRLPGSGAEELDQDHEWCEVETAEGPRRIRFHDYATIYSIPGLYERLFYDELRCNSPRVVRGLLEDVMEEEGVDPGSLVVLDLGAGNGMVGEELADAGVGTIVGIDILPEAAEAAARDRPGVYDDYNVVDLTEPSTESEAALTAAPFNSLTSVAALGFGDIPPLAFERAVDAVEDDGLVAFTIRDRFLNGDDQTGFSTLVGEMLESGALEPLVEHSYDHRLSAAGEPLTYQAIVARKND
jgi:predicted TPR repeat methyltransferase